MIGLLLAIVIWLAMHIWNLWERIPGKWNRIILALALILLAMSGVPVKSVKVVRNQ